MNLIRVPEPRIPGAYVLGPNPQHQYLEAWCAATLELAWYQQARLFKPTPVPMVVMDCSLSDGDTPGERQGNTRHPRNAHDLGINTDLTYPMLENPRGDYVVGKVKAGPKLAGPPTLLDVAYFAAWCTRLAMLDMAYGGLINTIAVDWEIEKAVEAHLSRFSVRDVTKRHAYDLINRSHHVSWSVFHHHHTHIRFVERRDGAEIAEAMCDEMDGLLAVEAEMPAVLVGAGR